MPAPGSSLWNSNRSAPLDGFFTPAGYRGAFGTSNWAAKWSNLGRLGYFATCAGSLVAVPDEVSNMAVLGDLNSYQWDAPTLPGLKGTQVYDVLRSSNPQTFTGAACVESNDADTNVTDLAAPARGQAHFYLVRAENSCGSGTLGFRSDGTERTGVTCP